MKTLSCLVVLMSLFFIPSDLLAQTSSVKEATYVIETGSPLKVYYGKISYYTKTDSNGSLSVYAEYLTMPAFPELEGSFRNERVPLNPTDFKGTTYNYGIIPPGGAGRKGYFNIK